jgi:peptidoglycan/xylan/chitin deacetylase (PgdA/CDA1 family)
MDANQKAASLSADRRKRVNQLKKTIIGLILLVITLLLVTCGILLARLLSAQKQIKKLKKENKQLTEEYEEIAERLEENLAAQVDSAISSGEIDLEDVQTSQQEEAQEGVKHVYLTFDDGPSENTDAVLDILKQYNIKATFFVIGKTDEESVARYKRIVAEGHSLGIHSYSHKYTQVYESLESFENDVLSMQSYLKEVTGVEVHYYRFPGGSSNTVSTVDIADCIRFLSENGFTYYDWNAINGDATGKTLTVEEMVNNVLSELDKYQNLMVLMHDGTGKQTTVEALPSIIEQLQARGAQILPITDATTPVQHKKVESVMGSSQ